MTYNDEIQATQSDELPEFFHFQTGNQDHYYTNHGTDLLFQFKTYIAAPIKRAGLNRDAEFSASSLTITTIPTDELKAYIATTPPEPTYVTIHRAVLADLTSFAVVFRGVVKTIQFADEQVQVQCIAESQFLEKRLPSVVYQSYCNNVLFDKVCALLEVNFKTTAVLDAVVTTKISSSTFSTKPDGFFNQGKVQCGTEYRLIINHIGDDLFLHVPFAPTCAAGVSVDAFPGCNKSPTTCRDKFNNLTNMVAMPYIPSKNPLFTGFK